MHGANPHGAALCPRSASDSVRGWGSVLTRDLGPRMGTRGAGAIPREEWSPLSGKELWQDLLLKPWERHH